jgi:HEAT repeat protein
MTLACFLLLVSGAVTLAQEAEYQGKTVQEWIKRLDDEDIRVRWYATLALGQLGELATDAVEPLMGILADQYEYEYLRGGAAWALGRIGQAAAVPLLTETLGSQHLSVRRNAPLALGNLGEAAKSAVPSLMKLAGDKDPTVKASAVAAVWAIDGNPQAMRIFQQMLATAGGGSYQATVALARLGPRAEPAAEFLATALNHADDDTRRGAARALGKIGPGAIPALEAALRGPDETTRLGAVEALSYIGADVVPLLITALRDNSSRVRRAAARALGRLGSEAAQSQAALIQLVNDPDQSVRDTAAHALTKIRTQSP